MPDVSELVVRAKPEGVDQTVSGFNRMEGELEDTKEELEDTSDELGGMAAKWKGAMGAIVAGLVTATAGLLSRVPVIGETMGALAGIADMVALKIDQDLRPTLQGFNNDLFETQTEVAESEGTLQALEAAFNGIDQAINNLAVSTLQSEIEELTGITIPENWLDFGWEVFTMDAQGAFNSAKQIVKNFKSDAITFLNNFETESGEKVGNMVSDTLAELRQLPEKGVGQIKEWVNDGLDEVDDFTGSIDDNVTGLVDDAKEWGKDMIDEFADGVESKVDKAKRVVKDLADKLRDYLPDSPANTGPLSDLDQTGPGLVDTFADGINANVSTVESAASNVAGSADPGGGRSFRAGSSRPQVIMNGKDLTENTGRYRRDMTSRRGRNG